METSRYHQCLATDAARLRDVAAGRLDRAVPSCPGWTVTVLLRHVAMVYLHKVEAMRRGAFPDRWPPEVAEEDPLALFDRAYRELAAEFAARDPGEATATWYAPERTVGFWIRRMAQETVIHRVDAELAAGCEHAPIPDDLAVDGVDEVLVRFLGYGSTAWPEEVGGALRDADPRPVRVATGGMNWLVSAAPAGVEVTPGGDGPARATVTGEPAALLLWLWRRRGDDAVRRDGDGALVDQLHDLLGVVTR